MSTKNMAPISGLDSYELDELGSKLEVDVFNFVFGSPGVVPLSKWIEACPEEPRPYYERAHEVFTYMQSSGLKSAFLDRLVWKDLEHALTKNGGYLAAFVLKAEI